MKRIRMIIILIQFSIFSFGQVNIKSMVDSLQYLNTNALDSDATIYRRIIAGGEAAIPFLIDKLNDTSLTVISYKCKATKLNVGEVANFALQEIIPLPMFNVTHIQFDYFDKNGCWSFYEYLFNNANKPSYQRLVREWYEQNKTKIKIRKPLNKSS